MKTLKVVLIPNKELVEDLKNPKDINISKFVSQIFNESMTEELERVDRKISKVKNPYKLILEVKTAKK